jgi:hypothetical protein
MFKLNVSKLQALVLQRGGAGTKLSDHLADDLPTTLTLGDHNVTLTQYTFMFIDNVINQYQFSVTIRCLCRVP